MSSCPKLLGSNSRLELTDGLTSWGQSRDLGKLCLKLLEVKLQLQLTFLDVVEVEDVASAHLGRSYCL